MTTTTPHTRWLLVGTSDIAAKRVGPALQGRLAGVVGGAPRAAEFAARFGAPASFDDLADALRQCDAPAVYIATAVHRHAAEARLALEAGRHVLIEKPLGLSAPDADAIVAHAARFPRQLAGCAYYRRTYLRFAHLKQLLAEGRLGRIVMVRTCWWGWFNPTPDDPKRWRVQKALSGGGPLADMGCHMIDLIVGLLGQPATAIASVATLAHTYGVEDSASFILTMPDGAQVTGVFGWNTQTYRHELEVVGTEGKVLWYPADTGKVVVTIGRDTQELDMPNGSNVHQPLVDDFEQAIAAGRPPIVPVAEAAKTNRVLDAIYRSEESGRRESV